MKHTVQFKILPLLVLALVLLSGTIFAQTPLGRIVGTVRDQSGAVVPGAKITVTNELTSQAVHSAVSNNEGAFVIPQLTAGSYSVKIETSGFKTGTYTDVKVDPGRDYSLDASVEVGQTNELVQVTAGADLVNTSTPEVTTTVSRRQIVDLPLNGRNPIELIRLQAGVVGLPTRTSVTINGGRPTWTQVTQDGINIQDNFIRVNSLEFVPNRPTSDTIGEFTITTNTQGADAAGGSSQVKLVTPPGESNYHGTLYEFNRNSALAANSWFNNATVDPKTGTTIPRAFLNRNQFGGNIGGPVLASKKVFGPLGGWNENKDKLFFFFTYEGFRQRSQTSQNNTVPVNDLLKTGGYRYVRPSDGSVQTVNVMSLIPGLGLDPKVQSQLLADLPPASIVNNFDTGNSTATRLLNTAGYRFNQSDANDRNQYAFRFDYKPTANHSFEFTHQRFKETDDRTDLDLIHQKPVWFTKSDVKFFVGAWRWTMSPKLNNELRVGANLAPVDFKTNGDFSGIIYALPLGLTVRESFTVINGEQGRNTRTFQYIDNASYVTGNHSFQFGGSLQNIKVNPYNFAGQFPNIGFGFSASAPAALQLTAANFPGGSISSADLASANSLRAFLGGVYTTSTQTFQVKDKTSGFVAGIPDDRNFTLHDWSFYFQDNWRLRSNLTLRLGLKWEYFTPLHEDNNLLLLPVNGSGSTKDALLNPNTLIDFVNGDMYGKDLNNFGPSVGIAWYPFKNGKTSIRFGYTMAFVNEETITAARNAAVGNAGLSTSVSALNLYGFFGNGTPVPATPTFKVPRTQADQLGVALTSAVFGIDKNLKQPYVHQISAGIEHEIGWDVAVEARYVATLGRDVWRGIDYNQVDPSKNPDFLADFKRAQSNGYLALASGKGFNPAFDAAIPGSQQLTVIPNFGGGNLTNSTVTANIQQGQVGSLADFYLASSGATIAAQARNYFYAGNANPAIYAADIILNGGKTDYHALQLEARRRFSKGLLMQANYTFSKVLTNSAGTSQQRFEPFINNEKANLERVRADFDVTRVFNASVIYELPFGNGKPFMGGHGAVDKLVGGWQVGSIIHAQSGAPISLLSARGTYNRGGRSGGNPIDSTLSPSAIKDLFGIVKQPDGKVYYINPKVIDPATGRGVGPDVSGNVASFAGQVFFNPNPGTIGSQQRLQFDGPSQTSWDFSIIKRTRITETQNLEIRADFFNFLNHPLFFVGDANVNSTTFGRITGLNFGPRVMQLALKYNF